MSDRDGSDLTRLLVSWTRGDRGALDKLVPLVQGELRRMARALLRKERSGHSLNPTALVHEVYLRLIDHNHDKINWQSRAHFYAMTAKMMRRILVDHARRAKAVKRGVAGHRVPLDENASVDRAGKVHLADVLAVHEALKALATLDPMQARLVELRFFGGLTLKETAEVLEISMSEVKYNWLLAKAWMHVTLTR